MKILVIVALLVTCNVSSACGRRRGSCRPVMNTITAPVQALVLTGGCVGGTCPR